MKRKDLYIILPVLIVAVALLLISIYTHNKNASYIQVNIGNESEFKYLLNEDGEYRLENEGGYNILVVQNGYVYIQEADCPNQNCVQTGRISKTGEAIVCLPHKISITVIQ